MRKIIIHIFLILFILTGFFYIKICQAINFGEVVINEIAWMGTQESANDEWIELKNLSNNEINLSGWSLAASDGQPSVYLSGSIEAGGFFLLERTDDDSAPAVEADLIYGGALNNSGEVLELKDSAGNLVDRVNASSSWPAGDNETKLTMSRNSFGAWQESLSPGGSPGRENLTSLGQAVCGDGQMDEGEECDDGNLNNNDGCDSLCRIEETGADGGQDDKISTSTEDQVDISRDSSPSASSNTAGEQNYSYELGDVVINEFVSDPGDGDTEWIELYNTTDKDIDLTGWIIEEGGGRKTALVGIISGSGQEKYFLADSIKGNLNNSGDIIILRDKAESLIEQIAYGNWDDGNVENNAPAAADPYSTARKLDGYNTYNNKNDFSVTIEPTKNKSNIIEAVPGEEEEEISSEEMAEYDYSSDIVISEIFPNPDGPDTENEFIELYNKGDRDVDLVGWRLGDESSRIYEIKNLSLENGIATPFPLVTPRNDNIIKANEFLVIYRAESKIALNNSTDSVMLYQPLKDSPLDTVKYENTKEGQSYARLEVGKIEWQWTRDITPGIANSFTKINHLPQPDFDCPEEAFVGRPVLFDSSDTVDEDGDKLEYFWDFGDKATNTLPIPEHTYFQAGAFTVKLTVRDKDSEAGKEKIINITKGQNLLFGSFVDMEGKEARISVSEFLPNPEGADAEGEFVELFNNSSYQVNLYNWRLDDMEGGSKPFTFKEEFLLGPGKYYVLWREQSGLALNNTSDSVRLYYNEELYEEVKYQGASEGESYSLGKNNKWFWTTAPTPGEENIISVSGSMEVLDMGGNLASATPKSEKEEQKYSSTTLEEIREFEAGDLVKVSGVVAVLPGVLGTQYFYIVGSPGIQVYNYKKEFPSLRLGDYIEVSGELSVSNTELRLKTKSPQDIRLAGFRGEPEPQMIECDKVSESNIGELISVAGEVVERKSSNVYLDDGTDEIKIYIKTLTGIDAKNIKEGEIMSVTGILGRTTSGLRLMPRFSADIVKKDPESREPGRVLGEVAVNDEWAIAQRDRKIELLKYLLVIAGGAIILLLGLLIKLELNKK